MTGRLVAALGHSSRTTRRLRLAVLAVLGLIVVASALAPSPHAAHRPVVAPAGPTRTLRAPTAPSPRPISGGLVAARRVAARFLAGYLPFLYGRGPARSIDGVTPGLPLQLGRQPALVTPVERERHPRLISLSVVWQAPAAVVATGLIADGGITAYALRMVLRPGRNGWLVSSVDGE